MPKLETQEVVVTKSAIGRFRGAFRKLETPSKKMPTMPTELAGMNSDQLGNLTSMYGAWREFTEDLHLEANCSYLTLKSRYDYAYSKQLVLQSGSTLTEKKTKVELLPDMQKLAEELLEAELFLSMVAAKLESFNNALTVLSRELTRVGTYRP